MLKQACPEEILNQACPEEILNQVQHDTFRIQNDSFRVQHDIFHEVFMIHVTRLPAVGRDTDHVI
jgi:hypothetical protein